MQVRVLLRTVGQTESVSVFLWGETLIQIINDHVNEEHQLTTDATIVDIRRAFRAMDTKSRNRILTATVDLEMMTIDVEYDESPSKFKPALLSAGIMIAAMGWLTYHIGSVADNPDVGPLIKAVNYAFQLFSGSGK